MLNNLNILLLNAALFLYLYFNTLTETALICWTEEDYSHGLLLPFISAYLIWEKFPEIKATNNEKQNSFSLSYSTLFLILGLIILLVGTITNLLYIRWLSLFISSTSILYLTFPSPTANILSPILLLNFMAKPLPDSLIPKLFFPLQVLAAKVSYCSLEILNVPVYLKGNIIEIPHMQLMVEEACSGLRSSIALLTVAAIISSLLKLKRFHRLLILLSSLVTAIILNIFRVSITGLLAHFISPAMAAGFFHTFSGLIVFIIGLLILYSIANYFAKRSL